MKRIFILISMFSGLWSSAQSGAPSLLLDGYTIDTNGRVGAIHNIDDDNRKSSYQLKTGRGWFRINEKNELVIKKGLALPKDRLEVVIQDRFNKQKSKSKFVILTDSFVRNKVIAHRGAWKNVNLPENSLASLQASFDLGCEGTEFDVHLSADSVLFVHHDANIGNVYIEKTNAAELRKLTLSNGEPLPLVRDFLNQGMKQNKTRLVLELKPSIIPGRGLLLARKVVEEVRNAHAEAWMIYISFDYAILREIQRLDPFAKCAYLKGDVSPEKLATDKMFGFDYNYAKLQNNKDWIPKAKGLGLTTNVWTVNDPALMDYFFNEGIDFITTNEPEIALQKIEAQKSK